VPARHQAKRRAALLAGDARYRAWSVTRSGHANEQRLTALKGLYTGRRCFVMGNGPSLLKCDLNLLASEVTIVSNAHYLIWDQLSYLPTFLTVEDPLVAEDRADQLRALTGVTRIFPFDLRPLFGASSETKLYVNFPRHYPSFPKFSHDLTRHGYWGGTVTYLNLQLAAYLGCDPIVLIGFDHSYVVPSQGVEGHVIHSQGEDVNHIHPDYFGPGYRWHDPNIERMEAGYRCARQELESMGVRVLNATVGGQLEIFERIPFDSVIQG
jgi:hypothetical protein